MKYEKARITGFLFIKGYVMSRAILFWAFFNVKLNPRQR